MQIIRVPSDDFVAERFDNGFYAPVYFDTVDMIRRAGLATCRVGSICQPWQFGAYALCNYIEWSSADSGIPYIKAEALGSPLLNYDGLSFVTPATHALLEKSRVKPGDVIVSTSGTIGLCAVIPQAITEANSNQDTIKFNASASGYDNYFIAAWFTCQYGQVFLNREAGGGVQQHVYLYNFCRLPVLDLEDRPQLYIGDKVRQAERLRESARSLEASIADKFTFLTATLLEHKKAWWASESAIDAYRINAPHYDAVVLDMLEKARTTPGLASLQSLVGARGIAGGATPLGAEYPLDGVFFVRVQNVKPYRLDLSDAAYIDDATDEELKRSRCAEGDVILSITGYPGTASIVMAEDLPVNINQHSVRFDIVGDLSPEFVTAALNSPFLKRQVDRLAIGGTREALDYTSVGDLQIPVLPKEDRDEITAWVTTSNQCVRAATRLTAASKFLVEALVEGKVTEAEMDAAQEALERGDDTADRALLSRLTRKGIDVAGEPPLFPDLDALYALLTQTEPATE